MYIAQAIRWGVISALGIRREESVAHGDLEHAHWDRATRTWHTHENEPAVIGRAA
ncbi:MAG TPA: hypothetical protein VF160_14245 [Candidatus Dormibacteraeota bacterium]